MNKEIDFENDCLIINRDRTGRFHSWRWYRAEKLDDIAKKLPDWNEEQRKREDGLQAELVTDQFIRDLCSYDGKIAIKSLRESINFALECLEDATSELKEARRGLE